MRGAATMLQEWENHIVSTIETHRIPGLASGISSNGKVIAAMGFGFRDQEQQLPATEHTTFGIASITKTVTALAIMMLQESGHLSVEDMVTKWLPEIKLPQQYESSIRIKHLLNHTSGIPNLTLYYRMMVNSLRQDNNYRKAERLPFNPFRVQQVISFDQFIELFNTSVYEWYGPPGINYSYSNEGYMLLDQIISRVSGLSYTEYVSSQILDPLGMIHTTFHHDDAAGVPELTSIYYSMPLRKWRHVLKKKTIITRAKAWISSGCIYGHGHLHSSVSDMLAFGELFYQGGVSRGVRLVKSETIEEMITGKYGVSKQKWSNGLTLVGHSGGQKGISSDLYIAVEAKVAVVALANIAQAPVWDVTLSGVNAALGNHLFDLPIVREPFTESNAEALATKLIGDYLCPKIGKLRIYQDQGRLVAKIQGIKGLFIPKFNITVRGCDHLQLWKFPAGILFGEQEEVIGFALGPGYLFHLVSRHSH